MLEVPEATGFAILNLLNNGSLKVALVISLVIMGLITGFYRWLKKDTIPLEDVRRVIKEGRIKRE